jgi:hypothetical protein
MPESTWENLPDWERVLSSAARLQRILPEAVLVGGTATALYARHRFSCDADHVLADLRTRFDKVLAELESVAGWKTARVQRSVQILGSLDGIETGVRQLIREEPLETTRIDFHGCGFSPRFSRASGSRGTNHRLQASRPSGGGLIRRKAFQAGVYPPPAQPTGFSR